MPLNVRLSALAADLIAEIRTEGEAKPTKPQGRRWKGIRRVLEEYLPEQGLNPSHIKRHDLSGVRAMHVGERDRIAWIASKDHNVVIVPMIGFVKQGDKGDTYPELVKHLNRGDFDQYFAELNHAKPGESKPPPMPEGDQRQ